MFVNQPKISVELTSFEGARVGPGLAPAPNMSCFCYW